MITFLLIFIINTIKSNNNEREMDRIDKEMFICRIDFKRFKFSISFLRVCLQTSYRSQISEAARHTKAAKTSASLS